jgi:colanic acid/amylovoran biosynthesis glycosyltransferase
VNHKGLVVLLYMPVLLLTLLLAPARTVCYFYRGWQLHRWDVLRRFYIDAPILRLGPQIIHVEFGALIVGRETLGRCIGCKLIVSFRGFDLNFSGLDRPGYYDQTWNYADALHLLGNDLWQRAIRRGCPPSKQHVLISPAIDAEYFSSRASTKKDDAGTNKRPFRILSVGRLEWKKGYEYALQAIKELADSGIDCEYHIVGGGGYLEALAFTRYQLELEQVVQFLGSISREQVKDQYEWTDVFLHSAVSEGFCNAVIEAQAMQLPVVCTDADGLSENVENGVTGFVVPRRDVQRMAEKLTFLNKDSELRTQMGYAGRRRVTEKFNLLIKSKLRPILSTGIKGDALKKSI